MIDRIIFGKIDPISLILNRILKAPPNPPPEDKGLMDENSRFLIDEERNHLLEED